MMPVHVICSVHSAYPYDNNDISSFRRHDERTKQRIVRLDEIVKGLKKNLMLLKLLTCIQCRDMMINSRLCHGN